MVVCMRPLPFAAYTQVHRCTDCVLLNKQVYKGALTVCRLEGTESKALTIAPGTRGVKEMYLNLTARRQGQPEQRINVSLSAAEMEVVKSIITVSSSECNNYSIHHLQQSP